MGILHSASSAFAGNIDGKWSMSWVGDEVVPEPYFTFKADGDKLTGTSIGSSDGKKIVAIKDGKINGKTISFQVIGDLPGKELKLNYKGVVLSDNEIKLSYTIEGWGSSVVQEITVKRIK
jgi:hypothetical protein